MGEGARVPRYTHKGDDEHVADFALDVCRGDERESSAWIKLLSIRTENLLSRDYVWRAVSAIAEALIARGVLSSTLASATLRKVSRETIEETPG